MNKLSNYLAAQFKQFDLAAIVFAIFLACTLIAVVLYVERPRYPELNEYGDKLPITFFAP